MTRDPKWQAELDAQVVIDREVLRRRIARMDKQTDRAMVISRQQLDPTRKPALLQACGMWFCVAAGGSVKGLARPVGIGKTMREAWDKMVVIRGSRET